MMIVDMSLGEPVPVQLDCSPRIRDYIIEWARNPEEGGTFDVMTRSLRSLPDDLLLRTLLNRGYSGLVWQRGDDVIGHVFHQQHGDRLHAFSIAVGAAYQGNGYGQAIAMQYVEWASQQAGVVAVRFSRGHNAISRLVLAKIRENREHPGWRVSEDAWIEFCAS